MKKQILTMALLLMAVSAPLTSYGAQWRSDSAGWWYEQDDGSYPRSCWQEIDGSWYCFDENGYMKTGWVSEGNKRYYLDSSGKMAAGTGRDIDGVYYRFDAAGVCQNDAGDPNESFSLANSNTVQWFNAAYAILTHARMEDYHLYGGVEKTAAGKQTILKALKNSWGVTDRASADETMNWLLNGGHRARFAAVMADWKAQGLMDMQETELAAAIGGGDLKYYQDMISLYRSKGDSGIDAWDYCRALELAAYYYVADIYSLQESLDKSLEIGRKLQSMYGSWDDMLESYLRGAEFWQKNSFMYDARKIFLDDLKRAYDNPYKLDWNTPLTKGW